MNHLTLPPDLTPERIVATLGLISDTHLPDRWAELQPAIFSALDGVDLILHAGDVGELTALDHLSAVAPVMAVHGNDETAEAQAALPYQQLLTIHGTRILLCHGHQPDRAAELASRVGDVWAPKLATNAARAHAVGATIYVSGHWHIPFVTQVDGVWLVNPGAIASGSPTTRQMVQTVARLYLRDDGQPFVVHIDVSGEPVVHDATVDWDAGFDAAHARYLSGIVAPDLQPIVEGLRHSQFGDDARVREMVTVLGRRVWSGETEWIDLTDLRNALRESTVFSAEERVLLRALINDSLSE